MDILNPRYSIYLLSVALLAALTLFSGSLLFDNTPRAVEYRGLYWRGFENSTFVPCRGDERWWADGLDAEPETELRLKYNSLVKEDGQPIYLVVAGLLSEKGQHGHLGGWDRTLRYRKVIEASAEPPADCQPTKNRRW